MRNGTMRLYYELDNEKSDEGKYIKEYITLLNASDIAGGTGPGQIGKIITKQIFDGVYSERSMDFEVEAGKLYGIGIYGYATGNWALRSTVKKLQLCYDPMKI